MKQGLIPVSPPSNFTLEALARALGGDIGGHQVLAPGPNHSPRDRSLSVRLSAQSRDGFVVFSFAGDDWRHCRDYVLEKLKCQPLDRNPSAIAPAPIIDLWKQIWREAEPLSRLALDYCASRGLDEFSLPEVESVVRFHPRCPFGHGERHPCIVALLRDVLTNRPRAVHRTALTRDGRKLGRKMLGPKTGAAIKLWPDDQVSLGLVIGEGIETVLAAATHFEHRGTQLRPAWALGDAGNLAAFPVLPGVEALTILVDHDESGTGQRAARKCGERWSAAGREAILLTPRLLDGDFNDLVKGAAAL